MEIKTQLINYFRDTLSIELVPNLWQPARRLPLFLRDGYVYYEIDLLGNSCLVMFDTESDRSATTIQKHIDQVKSKWPAEVIYAKAVTNSDERRRLVEQKIPFVVPGNQMYLPMLGIDFREYFRQIHNEIDKFTPATQAVLLLLMTGSESQSYNTQDLVHRLGYSKMTMSRSLNDLKNIDAVSKQGRARILEFDGERKSLWNRSLPYFESPVKQTQYIRTETQLSKTPVSGLTALSKRSMLAAPNEPTFAMTMDEYQKLVLKDDVSPAKETDPNSACIEVWSYDPKLFAKDNIVDPFSLYLSLRNDPDERVEEALEEMMEGVAW